MDASGCARDAARWPALCEALALGRQARTTLLALYQGWIDTLLALHAARYTGAFTTPVSAEYSAARQSALQDCEQLESEIYSLRALATRETQINRRVELNLRLQELLGRLEHRKQALCFSGKTLKWIDIVRILCNYHIYFMRPRLHGHASRIPSQELPVYTR